MEWILANKEWFFSGIGVLLITAIWAFFKFVLTKKEKENNIITQDNKNITSNSSSSVVSTIINVSANGTDDKKKSQTLTSDGITSMKDKIKILFIDDEKFMMVDILKEAGWINTKRVKDVTNLELPIILESHIIFVDINGIAKNLFKDQGIGLAGELKKKYPEKVIIIYSAESNGDRFHKTLRVVDECISKNAEPYEFIGLVEDAAKKIKI